MTFPDIRDDEGMVDLIFTGKANRIHPIYTDGQKVVSDLDNATRVAFFDRGAVTAKYQLKGDGNWGRVNFQ